MENMLDYSSLEGKKILICTRNEYQHLFHAKELLCGELLFAKKIDINDFFSSVKEVYMNTTSLWLNFSYECIYFEFTFFLFRSSAAQQNESGNNK